jgi:hypothetical protein
MRTPRTKIRRKEDEKGILRLTETTQTPPKSSDSCTQENNENNNNNNQQNIRILLLHFTNYNSESNPFPQTHKSKRRQNKTHQFLKFDSNVIELNSNLIEEKNVMQIGTKGIENMLVLYRIYGVEK